LNWPNGLWEQHWDNPANTPGKPHDSGAMRISLGRTRWGDMPRGAGEAQYRNLSAKTRNP